MVHGVDMAGGGLGDRDLRRNKLPVSLAALGGDALRRGCRAGSLSVALRCCDSAGRAQRSMSRGGSIISAALRLVSPPAVAAAAAAAAVDCEGVCEASGASSSSEAARRTSIGGENGLIGEQLLLFGCPSSGTGAKGLPGEPPPRQGERWDMEGVASTATAADAAATAGRSPSLDTTFSPKGFRDVARGETDRPVPALVLLGMLSLTAGHPRLVRQAFPPAEVYKRRRFSPSWTAIPAREGCRDLDRGTGKENPSL